MNYKDVYMTKTAWSLNPMKWFGRGRTISKATEAEAKALGKARITTPGQKVLPLEEDATKNVTRNHVTENLTQEPQKGHFAKHWPAYAAAGAVGIGGIGYMRRKRQENAPA